MKSTSSYSAQLLQLWQCDRHNRWQQSPSNCCYRTHTILFVLGVFLVKKLLHHCNSHFNKNTTLDTTISPQPLCRATLSFSFIFISQICERKKKWVRKTFMWFLFCKFATSITATSVQPYLYCRKQFCLHSQGGRPTCFFVCHSFCLGYMFFHHSYSHFHQITAALMLTWERHT